MAQGYSGKEFGCILGIQDISASAIGTAPTTSQFVSGTKVQMRLETVNDIAWDAGYNRTEINRSGNRAMRSEDIINHYGSGVFTWDFEYIVDKKLTWEDDLPVVNTFIVKQIKSINLTNKNKIIFPEITNFKNDIFFGQKLLKICIENKHEITNELRGKTPNWETERITNIDLMILKAAIAEILNFKLIPTKVSINEYIEISKDYSTPKSNVFINGVLDQLVKEFELENRLNKVGRGLI